MSTTAPAPTNLSTPRIVDRRLHVDGQPYLVLGGELHNSSSTAADLAERLDRVAALGVNTVLAPVYWELVEPAKGEYDFATVATLLDESRRAGLRLVPLWFGSWKNGVSAYRPAWMRHDTETYPLVRDAAGRRLPILSGFADANRDADAAAFAQLMAFLRNEDAQHGTVLMVQVQNEVGTLRTSRDFGPLAEAAYRSPVDPGFVEFLRARGATEAGSGMDWPGTFGESTKTHELFQALANATYIEAIARAGAAEYPVPLYTNAWLDSPAWPDAAGATDDVTAASGGQLPGEYPSGGPLPQSFLAWAYGAPTLSFLAPDIYHPAFDAWCEIYERHQPALFVPEIRRQDTLVGNILTAIGSHGAVGVSPFGIDAIDADFDVRAREDLHAVFTVLGDLAPEILDAQARGEIVGVNLTPAAPEASAEIGGYRLRIEFDFDITNRRPVDAAWGLVFREPSGDFRAAGVGFRVSFASVQDSRSVVALDSVVAEVRVGHTWEVRQILNGDETRHGEFLRFPPTRLDRLGDGFGETPASPRVLRARLYEY